MAMPTIAPRLITGPPLLPELIAASICAESNRCPDCR
jgi:hypothetical protein